VDNLRLQVAVVSQLTTFSGKLFQAFTLRHTNELERQFTLQCCFIILNEWLRLRITLQLMVSKREPASMSTKPYYNTLPNQVSISSFAVFRLPVCLVARSNVTRKTPLIFLYFFNRFNLSYERDIARRPYLTVILQE